MNAKPLYQSKTIWVQILAVIGALLPAVQDWVTTNPVSTVSLFAALNVLVRFVTHGKVKVFGGIGAASLGLMCVCMITGLAALSLTSCGGVKGTVLLKDAETGAKGGFDFRPGEKPSPWLRAPIRDANGKVIGAVDVRSGK